MALGSLPPWLNIHPTDFLAATESGSALGQRIAQAQQAAWEEDQRMRMQQEQHAIENAANRLAAERLEQYRQSEIANRQAELGIETKRLGSLDIQQQRADEAARHNAAMEEARITGRPEAAITTLPEAPGFTFLKNPSGALTPLVRPPHQQSALERARIQMSGINAMAPRGSEDPTSADYQSRTNAIGQILRSLNPSQPTAFENAPKDTKQRKVNTTYKTPKGLFTWTDRGWIPASTNEPQSLLSAPTVQDEEDNGE